VSCCAVGLPAGAAQAMTQLVIRGAAKEGLIKQRAGEKAAKRIAAAMASE
jgi:hypothetical protein